MLKIGFLSYNTMRVSTVGRTVPKRFVQNWERGYRQAFGGISIFFCVSMSKNDLASEESSVLELFRAPSSSRQSLNERWCSSRRSLRERRALRGYILSERFTLFRRQYRRLPRESLWHRNQRRHKLQHRAGRWGRVCRGRFR